MNGWLLDTNVVSELTKSTPDSGVVSSLSASFEDRILAVGKKEAAWAARLGATAQRSGRALHLGDALIAGTAKAHDLAVVTRNERDFEGIGVEVANPWRTL